MAQRTFTVPAGTVLPNGSVVEFPIVQRITYEKGEMTPAQAQKRARSMAADAVRQTYGVRVGVEDLQRRTGAVQKKAPTKGRAPKARGGRESYMSKAVRNNVDVHTTHAEWQVVYIGKPHSPVFQNIALAVAETFGQHHPDLVQVVGNGRYILELRRNYANMRPTRDDDDDEQPETINVFGKSPAYNSLAAFRRQNPTFKAFERNVGIEIARSVGWYIEFLPEGTLRARRRAKGQR